MGGAAQHIMQIRRPTKPNITFVLRHNHLKTDRPGIARSADREH
jgi:hypothetical protein